MTDLRAGFPDLPTFYRRLAGYSNTSEEFSTKKISRKSYRRSPTL
ncbi:hypothetical protein [Anabaena sp. CS-542/02]|nr:hypothetical protein [Anabaena sp. CS-542/02]